MCIAINIVKPHGVPTPREPNNAHKTRPKHGGYKGNTAAANNDGKEGFTVRFGCRQENLAAGPTNNPHNGAPQTDPGLLDQGDVPTEGGQVSPPL